ncbi:TetR/AcrR family transcriptional regulator [Streptococcus loxodontisalivarius]|uniref:AcrR family transcriptional regulator n=1 Tax=Streptococcus loxodontisalivarius TaxID=1349415 RepID=A0ABS2PQE0_9STRE|nr:TetR/AcrR family transcriptional regulator [Streptococcus loxodontisalivarius]MBM7642252.1 AcrR family transcriptional regulator [Streptococcus loxodontisalivarius]
MAEKRISSESIKNLRKSNRLSQKLTIESLETALLQLLENKSLKQLTISELVSKAGVSRNAFYRNFTSKEAILKGRFRRVIRRIMKQMQRFNLEEDRYQAWLFLFRESKKEAHLIRLAKENQLDHWLNEMVLESLSKYQNHRKKELTSYSNFFWSTAILSVLIKWISDGMTIPEEEMAAIDLPLLP